MLQSDILELNLCFFSVFFLFRSNSVFSGAVRIYAVYIDVFEKVGDRAKRGLQRKGSSPGNSKKKLHYGSCNQNYSGALLVNKISLVFLQSIKVILTLFFMPTILFTNLILMQIYAIQATTLRK